MAESRVTGGVSQPSTTSRLPAVRPPETSAADAVFRAIELLLDERQWRQGRATDRKGRLSLDGAVAIVTTRLAATERERIAMVARIRNQLSRCAGCGALEAWNDDPKRRVGDITELLARARFLNA